MPVTIYCQVCGKPRQVKPGRVKRSKFCGRACKCKDMLRSRINKIGDLTGKRFGRWTVLNRSDHKGKLSVTLWDCKCDCGTFKIGVRQAMLVSGDSKSCGCLAGDLTAERNKTLFFKHGHYKEPWFHRMITRIYRDRKQTLDGAWNKDMDRMLFAIQPACIICGSTKRLSVDHVRPISKGNGLKPGNAVRLCMKCNAIKGKKDLAQLPQDWQIKIINAANQFYDAWNNR